MIHRDMPFYANKKLRVQGKDYFRGEEVPVVALKLSDRKIEQLLKSRHLMQDFDKYKQALKDKIAKEVYEESQAKLKQFQEAKLETPDPTPRPARGKGKAKAVDNDLDV